MNHLVPTLSVVVPVHNGALWLAETLTSIYGQTWSDFELILVDDASTDNLREVLSAHPDRRLQVLHLERNAGVAGARNAGIAKARGQYIAFCDADDLCDPRRFELQLAYLQTHPALGACGTAFTCFDTEERETVINPATDADIRHALLRGNCFGMSTMMGRAELFRCHPFDQSAAPTEDYDMWTRLASSGVPLANLSQSLLRYRIHAQQASQQKAQRLDQLARKIRSLYCARLIGADGLVERLQMENIELADMDEAANRILAFCADTREFAPSEFRFMFAWMYQKLPAHGLQPWMAWRRLQSRLGIALNSTYRINTALLALLPRVLTQRHFDTLVKLKR
ncbi:glycosyltransferase family 2 protein [Rhodoferax mekongensis]|uniref:Glycosyltransferase family 2 protein n=1 Tax=Rhodoferax mekongensis TaxID=3068341 RepID=A0ABZ0AWR2_9BURK|nr:glycosyltransferase family 2 protein [Rhodoferax sp. TBRC 17307]WNO03725.1 glycosyltransferase family 2 protein [Rhodoferax sp. TBRC 17307]